MPEATCKTCPFWGCEPADRADASERPCRRHAPGARQAHRATVAGVDAIWPYTGAREFCGEHPLRQRDRLAAMAMQGVEAGNIETKNYGVMDPEGVASHAYQIADAMLAECAKRPTGA